MANEINYQKELDKLLANKENYGKKLLLHSCCAPCSSYVLTYLSSFFRITVYYYNPNITAEPEYRHRVEEQKRLIEELNKKALLQDKDSYLYPWSYTCGHFPIEVIDEDYNTNEFYENIKGLEKEPEGGGRCAVCFRVRLLKTYETALMEGADFFGTTLTISPLKNAKVINGIGYEIASKNGDYALTWMPSDFKKREGYKHSIELSAEYGLYRQNYCGCEFSKPNEEI